MRVTGKAGRRSQGVFRRFKGEITTRHTFIGKMPVPNSRVGPNPFVAGINPGRHFVIADPPGRHGPPGSYNFNCHCCFFRDKFLNFVTLLILTNFLFLSRYFFDTK
jgi:hypothetical protein